MANEVKITWATGLNIYVLVFNSAGQVWDQTNDGGAGSFEAYAAASIDNYDIALSEIATASGQYRGTFPANIDAGVYSVVAYLRAGANPAITDTRLGETGTMYWDGTAEITNNVIDTVVDSILDDTDLIDDATDGLAAIKGALEGVNVWYVNKSGNDANTGKTAGESFLTIGQAALAAFLAGGTQDVVMIGPGTYSPAAAVNLQAFSLSLKLFGAGQGQTTLTSAANNTPLLVYDKCLVKDMTVISTYAAGVGIDANSQDDVTLEDCTLVGPFDAIQAMTSLRFTARRCKFIGTYDGGNISGAVDYRFEDCHFYTDCTYAAADCRGLNVSTATSRGVFRNCDFYAVRADAQDQIASGLIISGRTWLDQCNIYASNTGGDGDVNGIYDDGNLSECLLTDCKIITASSGAGTVKDVLRTSGIYTLANTQYSSAKVTGTSAQVVNQDRAAIVSDDTRFAGADVATIKGYTDKIDDATDGLTAIKAEVEGLAGAAMRGTDSAALASVCTETRLSKLDATVSSRSSHTAADVTGGTTVAAAVTALQGGDGDTLETLSDQADLQATLANQTTLLARIGAFTGTGVNTILGFLKGICSKAASTPSDVGGTFSATTDSLEAIQEDVATVGGTGATAETYTVTDSVTGLPIDGCTVWVTTDEAGTNIIADGETNAAGEFTFYHDLTGGTAIYIWRQMAGYNFDNPDTEATT